MIYHEFLYRKLPFLVSKTTPIPFFTTGGGGSVSLITRVSRTQNPHSTLTDAGEPNGGSLRRLGEGDSQGKALTLIGTLLCGLYAARGDWGSFLYQKREFSIQEFMIYHHISCFSHDISLYIIYEIMIYHVPRRHMI